MENSVTPPSTAMQQIPNVRVWLQGKEYVESAEILMDYNRLQPAVVLAALAAEIFLKSFLATRLETGRAETKWGHSIDTMFKLIPSELQTELLACSFEINPAVDFVAQLKKHDSIFVSTRYRYEPTAPALVSSDTVRFARHLCDSVFLFGKRNTTVRSE